jgi:hypothetical protein
MFLAYFCFGLAIVLSFYLGWTTGTVEGARGSGILRAMGKGWALATPITWAALSILILITGPFSSPNAVWGTVPGILSVGLFVASLVALFPSTSAAFIAYNFATQRRVRKSMAGRHNGSRRDHGNA